MSNATLINNPFWVECISGEIDGMLLPQAQEPAFGAKIRVEQIHTHFAAPDGAIITKNERRIYTYRYIKNGKALPLEK